MAFVLMRTNEYKYLKLFNGLHMKMFSRIPAYAATSVLKTRLAEKSGTAKCW